MRTQTAPRGLGDIPPDKNYVPFVLFVLIITAARAKKPERLPAIRAGNSRGPLFFAGQKKEPAASYSRMGGSHTTLGDGALDCRVRNGNGYDNSSMATGKKPESRGLKRTTAPHGKSEGSSLVKQVNKLSRTSG